jgi:hypothetical protein
MTPPRGGHSGGPIRDNPGERRLAWAVVVLVAAIYVAAGVWWLVAG